MSLALAGCGEEPEPIAEEATPSPELGGGLLFASSADDIVMKEAPKGAIFGESPKEAAPAPATAARAGGDAPSTGGRPLSAKQIKRVVKAKTPQVRACYERELKMHDGLRGKVVLGWTIRADGTVTGARAVSNSTRNSAMVPCMTRAVANWRFPRASEAFDVEYPFVFKPRDY